MCGLVHRQRKPGCVVRGYWLGSSCYFGSALSEVMENLNKLQRQVLMFLIEQFEEDARDERKFNRVLNLLLSNGTVDGINRPLVRRPNIDRERVSGHGQLVCGYFAENLVYGPEIFRHRFRMERTLFRRIEGVVVLSNDYFLQKCDALGVLGLTSLQKITVALRMLAYDKSADEVDEYICIGETTTLRCMKEFCMTMVVVFGAEYLRQPTVEDVERILKHSANRGFPGMLDNLDCMHWDWKNCPRAWVGQFLDRTGSTSLVLEAVATYDLWIWHSFFGMAGSNNDINVLDKSNLFKDLLQCRAPTIRYFINNRPYDMCYYLVDGIYPQWPVFVHTISNPLIEKRKYFAMRQEAARKDVERCFGVLRGHWSILKNPTRLWQKSALHNVMMACIILHNMIVEDEQESLLSALDAYDLEVQERAQPGRALVPLAQMIASRVLMRNRGAYHVLQANLVQHLWNFRGFPN